MFSKSIFASKTFWANLLGGLLQVIGLASGAIPPQYAPYLAAAQGILNIILRLLTNQPVHIVTPQTVTQSEPGAPTIKSPTQTGCVRIWFLLCVVMPAAFAWTLLTGCASNATTSQNIQTTATGALAAATAIQALAPQLLAEGKISSTAEQAWLRDAGVLEAAAQACLNAVTTVASCSASALTAGMLQLAADKATLPAPVTTIPTP